MWGDSEHNWVKPAGRLQTGGPGAYKIPSADDIPTDWRVTALKDAKQDSKYETIAVHSSKAVGEPPLLLGISVYTALRSAIKAARKQEGLNGHFHVDSPLSSERIRMACADKFSRLVVEKKEKVEHFKAKLST